MGCCHVLWNLSYTCELSEFCVIWADMELPKYFFCNFFHGTNICYPLFLYAELMDMSIITGNRCFLYAETNSNMDELFPHWSFSFISAGPLWDYLSIRFLSANRDWWHPQQNWWFECGFGRIRWPCFGWRGGGDVNGSNSHSGPHSYISFSFSMLHSLVCLYADSFALWFERPIRWLWAVSL